MQFSIQKINPKYLGLGSLGLFLFGSLFGFVGFPKILHSIISSQLNLKKGGEMRDIWSKIPDPFHFKVYVFNVSNPADVQKGAKPVVIEVGPFSYILYKEKVNITDHDEDDTVSFNTKETWYFDRERSDGMSDDTYVTVPHPALLSIILSTERERPMALKIINKSFDALFGKTTSILLTTTVRKLLFDGIPIYCNVTEFSAKAVCAELRKRDQFQKFSDDVFGFSFFGLRNATPVGRYRVKRGIKNIGELGQIIQYNGQKKMEAWNGEECNRFIGSDSTIFSPFKGPNDKLGAYSPVICRSLEPYHVENITYKGLQTYTYTVDFGDMSQDPKLKCFCTTPDACLKKGVHDMTNCVGVPMIASLPHFYLADPDYQNAVYGMNPIKDKHEMYSIFEPTTATPLFAHTRIQISISIHPIETIDLMKEVPTVIFPIFWIDEGFELNKKLVNKVKMIFAATTAMDVIKWLTMVAGLGLGGASAFLMKKMKDEIPVNVVPPRKSKAITPLDLQSRY